MYSAGPQCSATRTEFSAFAQDSPNVGHRHADTNQIEIPLE